MLRLKSDVYQIGQSVNNALFFNAVVLFLRSLVAIDQDKLLRIIARESISPSAASSETLELYNLANESGKEYGNASMKIRIYLESRPIDVDPRFSQDHLTMVEIDEGSFRGEKISYTAAEIERGLEAFFSSNPPPDDLKSRLMGIFD